MSLSVLHYLCLVTLLSHNLANCTTDDEEPRRTFPFRRAIDGSRGRKFYDPEDDGFLHTYGSSGRYDPDHQINDFSDIRNNVPGEPGIDYPAYTRLPQTGFVCEADFRGYYADEEAGCQVFHVCDGSFLVSSFLCPMGSIFSQKLLTCDWWAKVDCSLTRNYHVINTASLVSEADDDEILRKAFEMSSVQSAGERIPAETVNENQDSERQDRRYRIFSSASSAVTDRANDLLNIPDKYSDYPDYSSRKQSSAKFQSRGGQKNRKTQQEDDYYVDDAPETDKKYDNNSPIRVHTIGDDRRNDRTFGNEFKSSYAPTVPTVITTTRRFYSPTFPTTYRPPTERQSRGRYDLDFESSDHLYNAKGRNAFENVKVATAPSVGSKPTTTESPEISLAMLVNSADERRYEIDNMQESESSYYRTTVTIPSLEINTKKIASTEATIPSLEINTKKMASTEATISKNVTDEAGKITETFSILTIDNDNRNPDAFAYNQEKKSFFGEGQNVKVTSTLDDKNSTIIGDKKIGKIAAFLEPPQEMKNQFQIRVLDESEVPKNHRKSLKSKKIDETDLRSQVEVIPSIEIPNIPTNLPLVKGKSASRESRVIRIFVDKRNDSNDDFRSIEASTAKLDSDDLISLVEDSEGQHSETKLIAEELPEEEEKLLKKMNENENLTRTDKIGSTDFSTNSKSQLEKSHLIDLINAAVALESSRFNFEPEASVKSNSNVPEERKSDDEKIEKISANSRISDDEENKDESDKTLNEQTKKSESKNGDEEISLERKIIVAEEKNKPSLEESKIDSKFTISDEKNSDDDKKSDKSEEKTTIYQEKNNHNLDDKKSTLLNEKTLVDNEKKIVEQKESKEILLTAATTEKNIDDDKNKNSNEKTTFSQEKSIDLSIGNEEISLKQKIPVAEDKNNENYEKSKEIKLETIETINEGKNKTKERKKTTVTQEKSIELSIVSEPITFDPKTIDDNYRITEEMLGNTKITSMSNEKISKNREDFSNGNIEDSPSKASSPLPVTLIVNRNEKIDSSEKIIGKSMTDKTIDDFIAATDDKNVEIIKSDQPEASKNIPRDVVTSADSGSDGKIKLERNVLQSKSKISEEQKDSLSNKHVEDSVVEDSSPLPVTLIVNRNEKIDSSDKIIGKSMTDRKIDDSVAAADDKNVEIIKSVQPEASKIIPRDAVPSADSGSDGKIKLERNVLQSKSKISEEQKDSLSNKHVEDSVVEGSSPLPVTLIVDRNEKIDSSEKIIVKSMTDKKIDDSIAAADDKNVEIIKSVQPEASKNIPRYIITSIDSGSDGKIKLEGNVLHSKTKISEDPKDSSSNKNMEDSVVEGSSPLPVTLTPKNNKEIDSSVEVIRKLIADQKIDDSVAAADDKNFEIIKSDQPEASQSTPDSGSDGKIKLEKTVLHSKSKISEEQKDSSSNKNMEDSMVEGSSPLPVTLTVKNNKEIDSSVEVIRKLIADQKIDDSVAATDDKNVQIIKSDQPEASQSAPDSGSDGKIKSDTNISKESLQNFRSNVLQSKTKIDDELKDSISKKVTSLSAKREIIANIDDSVVEGSSPLSVTLTVNNNEEFDPSGELIRKLIADQNIDDSLAAADYKNFEIIKSDQPEASSDAPREIRVTSGDSRNGRKIELERNASDERLPNFRSNVLQSRDYYRSIISLVNGPNNPRPFSLESPQIGQLRALSDIGAGPFVSGTSRNGPISSNPRIPPQETLQSVASSISAGEALEKSSSTMKIEISNTDKSVDQLGQNFGERLMKKNNEKLIFELPHEQRTLDFKTGQNLDVSKRMNSNVDSQSEEFVTTEQNNDNFAPKTVVQTEFIPSISFALNTDKEREEFMEAVMKGLLSDIRATESTNNDTNVSLES